MHQPGTEATRPTADRGSVVWQPSTQECSAIVMAGSLSIVEIRMSTSRSSRKPVSCRYRCVSPCAYIAAAFSLRNDGGGSNWCMPWSTIYRDSTRSHKTCRSLPIASSSKTRSRRCAANCSIEGCCVSSAVQLVCHSCGVSCAAAPK